LAPDLPGFGESSKPPDGDYSIGAQAECSASFSMR
jgi:pimeloyl-ACP methyl ester carboxylesterase